jgi:UDP-N-acetylmuramate dehydrogenase
LENKSKNQQFIDELNSVLVLGTLLLDEPMSQHTTFQIGGPADYFVMAKTIQEVAHVVRLTKQYGIELTIFGNGSNVLVLDGGIDGLVLQFGTNMADIRHHAERVISGAGAMLADVAKFAAVQQLTGLEFAVGIPGSIGGAVFMNAGAYNGEIKNVISAVVAVCPDASIYRFTKEELQFDYRHSVFQQNHCIICEVEMELSIGSRSAIYDRMQELTFRREAKQPLEMPSAGSTFKRPNGYFAGTLIEQTGLKGLRVGGAEVSAKHAGFVVNTGGATAQDVLDLIGQIQQRVQIEHGVLLNPEVRVIGRQLSESVD